MKILLILLFIVSLNSSFVQPLMKNKCVTHIYFFDKYNRELKPNFSIDTDKSAQFQRLNVDNYSVTELFALALGKGVMVQKKNIIVQSSKRTNLDIKYCYRLSLARKDSDQLYALMLESIKNKFPDFKAIMEKKAGKNVMVIKDL